jgi:drug/metabolite transporter (DMT)-like permease
MSGMDALQTHIASTGKKVNNVVPSTTTGKILMLLGAVCLIAAIVLVYLPEEHGEFDMPLWVAAAIVSGMSVVSVLYYAYVPYYGVKGCSDIPCIKLLRNEAIRNTLIAGLLAAILATRSKYKGFKITTSPEMSLFIASYILWIGVKFVE